MAKIIEASENLNLEAILTVVSERGDEYSVNADALAVAFADLLAEQSHEQRMGWDLGNAWFKDAFFSLKEKALKEHRAMLAASPQEAGR